jgi:MSHA biogenesis protein MshL
MGIDWGTMMNRGKYYGTLDSKRTLSSPAFSFNPEGVNEQSLTSTYGVFQMAFSNNMVDFVLDSLSRQGNVKVLASPRISTLNNEKAVIRVVREEAFFSLQTEVSQSTGGNVTAPTINVQIVPVGIVMDIVPQISASGEIVLSINPDISELLEVKKFEVQGAMAMQPVIDRRSIDTVARMRDGETLVIAGILKERKSEVVRGVPFLYKLPLIGNLFRRTEQVIDRTELVILITPRIVAGKVASELTSEEIERLRKANLPLRLGDAASLKEGIRGEFKDLKKDDD